MDELRTVIKSTSGWQPINIKELWKYKDLLYFLVQRDIRVLYKQTVLGFGWAIIRPVVTMIIFSIVFGRLANIPSDGVPYPIFSFTALLPWTYFATAMTKSTNSLIAGQNLITKVYFPRMIIPITPVLAGLVDFAIASTVLVLMMFWFRIVPTWNIVFLPLLIAVMILSATGIGMWLSALGIQYRDVQPATQFLSQVLMYAAPVAWPVSLLALKCPQWEDAIRLVYGLYPMAGVIEGFRSALLGTTPMPWDLIIVGTISSLIMVLTGASYFQRMERFFADVA